MKQIRCPACDRSMPETDPCEHYKKYNWKPGENETFFIKLIQQNYAPGSFGGWKNKRKSIGTSAGNSRTKNTLCKFPGCNKDLNRYSFEKIEEHKQAHDEFVRKQQGQATLL